MLFVRRVSGSSMLPSLCPGSLIVAKNIKLMERYIYKLGDVILFEHNGIQKLKRIANIRTIDGSTKLYVVGDNAINSTDSRHFGWITTTAVKGKLIWPIKASKA